ncbi:MAG: hypothetical protein RJA59_2005, partial [Pseudomonadota bacterium]
GVALRDWDAFCAAVAADPLLAESVEELTPVPVPTGRAKGEDGNEAISYRILPRVRFADRDRAAKLVLEADGVVAALGGARRAPSALPSPSSAGDDGLVRLVVDFGGRLPGDIEASPPSSDDDRDGEG